MYRRYAVDSQPLHFSAAYRNLSALEQLGGFSELFVEMKSFPATFFPVYYVRTKLLHLISPSYYTREKLDYGKISPRSPLFKWASQVAHRVQVPVSQTE